MCGRQYLHDPIGPLQQLSRKFMQMDCKILVFQETLLDQGFPDPEKPRELSTMGRSSTDAAALLSPFRANGDNQAKNVAW